MESPPRGQPVFFAGHPAGADLAQRLPGSTRRPRSAGSNLHVRFQRRGTGTPGIIHQEDYMANRPHGDSPEDGQPDELTDKANLVVLLVRFDDGITGPTPHRDLPGGPPAEGAA